MLPRPSVLVARVVPIALTGLLVIFSLTYLYCSPIRAGSTDNIHLHFQEAALSPPSSLPVEYDTGTAGDSNDVSDFCNDRFNTKYIDDIRNATFQYCDAASSSSFTCFHSQTTSDANSDSMCIAQGALVNVNANVNEDPKISVNCNVREPGPDEVARGIIPLASVRQYWYETGPRFIIDKHFNFIPGSQVELVKQDVRNSKDEPPPPPHFALLVKREGEANPWHCLMEIWSMTMTMDVLRTTIDPSDPLRRPYFRAPEDAANLQVVILDDRADGPYLGLWKLFSGREPIRLGQIRGNPEALEFFNNTNQHLILPFAGAANPTWQNDWSVSNCTRSDTLRVFVRRVLGHYGIQKLPSSAVKGQPVRVTVIDRKRANTRQLANQDLLIAAVRARFPLVEVHTVDFGTLSFAEQLAVAQSTDVLVGIHGAGLTHTMFLRETSAVVEIQPLDMDSTYMGFRNMAGMRGVSYFRAEARPVNAAVVVKRASWHTENFEMDIDDFVQVVGDAIRRVRG